MQRHVSMSVSLNMTLSFGVNYFREMDLSEKHFFLSIFHCSAIIGNPN